MPEWSADAVVDEALARRLIAQFPELTIESLQLSRRAGTTPSGW